MNGDLERLALAVLQPGFTGTTLAPEVSDLLTDGLGGVCLFGMNARAGAGALEELCAAIHEANPATVIAVDEEGGDVTRVHARTGSPVLGAAALGFVDDLELTRATGRAVGAELASLGIDLDLAPIADVNSNPDNPVIGTRSFGTDARSVAGHVVAWSRGLQEAGVAACVKHFPGHGDTGSDSHVELPVLDRALDELFERELVPFAAVVEAGVAAVMTSHILLPALDPELPATLSAPVLAMLRDRFGFTGAIVSDALDMAGASAGRGIPEAAVLALAAGVDVLCLGPAKTVVEVREVQTALVEAVKNGRVAESRLVDAAARGAALRRTTPGPPFPDTAAPAGVASLRVEGTIPPLAGARIVTVRTAATIAVGDDVPWGLPPDVALREGDPVPAADGTPVIVQVRDLHRQPWAAALVDRLVASSPAIVVEWGWPGPPTSGARICTHGWSLPGAAAVREVLREAGWTG